MKLNSWRHGRDNEGWITPEAKKAFPLGKMEPDGDPPEHVKIVPCFHLDLKALTTLTAMESPPDIPIRASHDKALYIVGESSGSGFGLSWWVQDGIAIDAKF